MAQISERSGCLCIVGPQCRGPDFLSSDIGSSEGSEKDSGEINCPGDKNFQFQEEVFGVSRDCKTGEERRSSRFVQVPKNQKKKDVNRNACSVKERALFREFLRILNWRSVLGCHAFLCDPERFLKMETMPYRTPEKSGRPSGMFLG